IVLATPGGESIMSIRSMVGVLPALSLAAVTACGSDVGGFECGAGTIESEGVCVPGSAAGTAPTISAISPAAGLVGGGELFTITGSGFLSLDAGATIVSFGDHDAPAVVVVSDTEIQGVTPQATSVD